MDKDNDIIMDQKQDDVVENNNKDIEDKGHIEKKQKINKTTTTTSTTTSATNNKDKQKKEKKDQIKQMQNEAIYGNYHGYYNYRNEKSIEKDPRLIYLKKEYFYQKNCLDIGCNSGDLVFKISKDYYPTHITGVDIDKFLINRAFRVLLNEQYKSNKDDNNNNNNNNKENETDIVNHKIKTKLIDSKDLCKIGKNNFIPISFRMILDSKVSNDFPNNISFYCHNFLHKSKSIDIPKSYDVITALSISKWIHLNWGDEGIKKFFFKIYELLKDDGIFLFEPQPYKGYSKRKHLSELINKNFNEIQFKPNQFIEFLIEQVKFKSYEFLNEGEAKSKGFDRPLYKFIK